MVAGARIIAAIAVLLLTGSGRAATPGANPSRVLWQGPTFAGDGVVWEEEAGGKGSLHLWTQPLGERVVYRSDTLALGRPLAASSTLLAFERAYPSCPPSRVPGTHRPRPNRRRPGLCSPAGWKARSRLPPGGARANGTGNGGLALALGAASSRAAAPRARHPRPNRRRPDRVREVRDREDQRPRRRRPRGPRAHCRTVRSSDEVTRLRLRRRAHRLGLRPRHGHENGLPAAGTRAAVRSSRERHHDDLAPNASQRRAPRRRSAAVRRHARPPLSVAN